MSEPYTPYGDAPTVQTCPCVQCTNVGHPLCAVGQIRSLRSQLAECQKRIEALMSAIRHCAGESEYDALGKLPEADACSECCRIAKHGHEAWCWRRFAFENARVVEAHGEGGLTIGEVAEGFERLGDAAREVESCAAREDPPRTMKDDGFVGVG